eukprot:Nitzschia sp. Nitz4//scaffold286_size23798//4071//5242//NITZ4_008447-RA/size23798-snap-gene-0.1-mRNA-1//1//CDS//3329545729//2862//frame0
MALSQRLLVIAALLGALLPYVVAQFNEPESQARAQTFSVLEFEDGTINQGYDHGPLRYYCTFRGKWNEKRHPEDFPKSASWSAPVMISHSNGYRMWTGTEAATLGVESIAEEGFTTIITNEFNNAGFETLQMVVGERMFNTSESQHLPPINVTEEESYLSAMVKMTPSPDWFIGFSDFRTISYDTETYFNRFVIKSHIWDCGTDAGQTYTAIDRDLDPQEVVSRFYVDNVPPKGQFLSPDGTFIPIPGEFECVFRVDDGEVIPGIPFNESQIRPPLYVPRDDDWIGDPDQDQDRCAHGNYKTCNSGAPASILTRTMVWANLVAMFGMGCLFVW